MNDEVRSLKRQLANTHKRTLREVVGCWLLAGTFDTCLSCNQRGFYHWFTYNCQWCGTIRDGIPRGDYRLFMGKCMVRWPLPPAPPPKPPDAPGAGKFPAWLLEMDAEHRASLIERYNNLTPAEIRDSLLKRKEATL